MTSERCKHSADRHVAVSDVDGNEGIVCISCRSFCDHPTNVRDSVVVPMTSQEDLLALRTKERDVANSKLAEALAALKEQIEDTVSFIHRIVENSGLSGKDMRETEDRAEARRILAEGKK